MSKLAPCLVTSIIGVISITLGFVLFWIRLIVTFLGQYTLVLSIPMIVGGCLSLIGSAVLGREPILGYDLMLVGGVIGIINALSLIAIPLTRKDVPRREKSNAYLLVLPIIILYLMLALFIIDTEDKSGVPLNWRGRNGLTLLQTIWDTNVFWGELWFNLLLACLFTAILLVKFHPANEQAWRFTQAQEKKVLACSGIICTGIVIVMAITWQPSFSIAGNWYSSQFAYQVTAWPSIIGFAGITLATINVRQHKASSNLLSWIFLGGFLGIWIYLAAVTNFSPHAIYDINMSAFTLIMTIAFPCSLIAFLVERIKNKPETSTNPSKRNLAWCLPVLIAGIALIIGLQFVASTTVPMQGRDTMFAFDFQWWWWPLSHAWGWLFTGALTIFCLFASRTMLRWYHARHREIPRILAAIQKRSRTRTSAMLLAGIVVVAALPVLLITQAQWSQRNQSMLLVNQVGYYPKAPKRVIFQSADEQELVPDSATFAVIDESTGNAVFNGGLVKNITNKYGHNYMVGNFDALHVAGHYHVEASISNAVIRSPVFEIGEHVYDRAIELALRFFYYQRCGYAVQEVVPGYVGHPACHVNDADVWNGNAWVYKNLTGGWHDAGDYNKYNSWFQTQWYCDQALSEASLLDPHGLYSSMNSLYDTSLPDTVDESLWGAQFLVHCINVEGLQGADKQWLVFRTVSGFRQDSQHEARMSYMGSPDMDWATPRRVLASEADDANASFCGYFRGYDIAGQLMQIARLLDTTLTAHPGIQMPSWFPWNVTYLRTLAANVYAKYLSIQDKPDEIQSYIGKFFYLEEKGIQESNNFTAINNLVSNILPLIGDIEAWPLWFGWASYYMLGNMLRHYLTFNLTIPVDIMNKLKAINQNHYVQLFEEPFRVKEGRLPGTGTYFSDVLAMNDPAVMTRVNALENGTNILFYGAERQTDMLTSAWLQLLATRANATGCRPELVQSYLDWLFGVNPQGLSLMEGVGSKNMPQYHSHDSWAGNPRGAVPGAIPNGLAQAMGTREYAATRGFKYNETNFLAVLGDRCTYGDWPANPLARDMTPSNPNEMWIPHDAMLLRIFTALAESNLFA